LGEFFVVATRTRVYRSQAAADSLSQLPIPGLRLPNPSRHDVVDRRVDLSVTHPVANSEERETCALLDARCGTAQTVRRDFSTERGKREAVALICDPFRTQLATVGCDEEAPTVLPAWPMGQPLGLQLAKVSLDDDDGGFAQRHHARRRCALGPLLGHTLGDP